VGVCVVTIKGKLVAAIACMSIYERLAALVQICDRFAIYLIKLGLALL
jgi:hypothetical protein